jgi:hypothetical protein
MTYCLTPAELADLTGKQRASAQARELEAMGIAHRRRRDGSIAVLRIHAEVVPGKPYVAAGVPKPEPKLRPA